MTPKEFKNFDEANAYIEYLLNEIYHYDVEEYGLFDLIDDICDAITWRNIKKTLKKIIYYLR